MINYPISFFAQARSAAGIQTPWTLESQTIGSICAVPPEFEGPGGALSPEDLFTQALASCFVATFKVYAEKSKINFESLHVEAHLIADLNDLKKPVMKNCLLQVSIRGCESPERIKTLAEKAFKSGFILNSVKTEMALELQVE